MGKKCVRDGDISVEIWLIIEVVWCMMFDNNS
jgi:hypothetical protein